MSFIRVFKRENMISALGLVLLGGHFVLDFFGVLIPELLFFGGVLVVIGSVIFLLRRFKG